MGTIAGLVVNLELNMARFSQGLNDAQGMAERAMKNVAGAADLAKSALGGLAGAFTIGGLVAFVKSTVDSTARLRDLSQQTGITVEKMSAIERVAKQADTAMAEVAGGAQKLSKKMYEVYSGSETAGQAFAALGLKVTDAAGKLKTPDQMLLEIAKKLATFQDGAGKTALMMELFGKSGANLGKFLADLAEKQELVGNRSTEQAERAEAFEKAMRRMGEQTTRFAQSLVIDLLPALEKSLPLIKSLAQIAAVWFAVFVAGPPILAALTTAWAVLAGLVATATVYFAASTSVFEAMNTSLYGTTLAATAASGALGKLQIAGGVLFAAWAGWKIGKTLSENFLEAQLAGIALVQGLMKGWEWLKFGFNAAIEGMKTVWGGFLEAIGKGLSKIPGMALPGRILQELGQSQKGATMASLAAGRDAAIANDAAIFNDMADAAIAKFQSTEKLPKGSLKDPPKLPDAARTNDLLKKRLEGTLKILDQAIESEKKLLGEREAMLDRYYRDDRISIADYFEGRAIAMQIAADNTQRHYAQEIAAVEAWQAHYKSGTAQYEEAAKKIGEIQGKAAAAQQESAARMGQAAYDQGKAYEDLGRKVQSLNADYEAMLGNLGAAAAIRFDVSNESLRKRLGVEGMADELAKLDALRARAIEDAATDWESGVSRSLRKYIEGVRNVADASERLFANAFKGMEDALVSFVKTGKLDFRSLADSIISDLLRITIQQSITLPLAQAMSASGGLISAIGGWFGGSSASEGSSGPSAAAGGGTWLPAYDPAKLRAFDVGTDYVPRDMIALIHEGERITPKAFNPAAGARTGSGVVVNIIEAPGHGGGVQQRDENGVTTIDVMVEQVESRLSSNVARGRGSMAAVLERRYGLNPAAGAVR